MPFGVVAAVGLALLFVTLATGALHEDGFMDVCDGFGLLRDRTETIKIMRDPQCGAFAVVGIVMLVGIRWSTLIELAKLTDGGWPLLVAILVAAHGISRWAAVWPITHLAYVGGDGRSAGVVTSLGQRGKYYALMWAFASLLPAFVMAPGSTVCAVLAVLGGYTWATGIFRRRLGGYTGDCLGATQQICEVVFYLGCLAALRLL